MHRIPQPDLRELLLPLLSCLPTAFISGRPPPALLALLSPILRQRVQFRSSNIVASPTDPSSSSSNWLSLLTWSPSRAARLVELCSDLQLEPHPVSGELELFGDEDDEEAGKPRYLRLDSETIHARCDVREHGLAVIWVWCVNDNGSVGLPIEGEVGEPQDGWKVTDVQPWNDDDDDDTTPSTSQWHHSIAEAEEAYDANGPAQNISRRASYNASLDPRAAITTSSGNLNATPGAASNLTNDDDDYWASYDQTPDRTPHRSPGPPTSGNANYSHPSNVYNPSRERQASASMEADYYARYGSVQPALDAHDPDEEQGASAFESTLRQSRQEPLGAPPGYSPLNLQNGPNQFTVYNKGQVDVDDPPIVTPASTVPLRVHSPTPSRPSTSSSGRKSPIEILEDSATSSSAAEIGVKQHISTELKSLYRLARAAGIERAEFERVVRTELDVLGLMDV